MKTAIVVSGNLRTFFMPTRENPSVRLFDLFTSNIVNFNNADVFAFTDTNDFYLGDTQYFSTDKKIEILNNDTSRLCDKIDFIDTNSAKDLIIDQFSTLGANLKSIVVEGPFNINDDPKFKIISDPTIKGNSPALLLHQARKTKMAYSLLKNYELQNNTKYDLILRWRFDNSVNGNFNFNDYDFSNCDVYVPGIHSPVIYDWFALGTRDAMDKCLSLYDFTGQFLNDGKMYICSKCSFYGSDEQHNCKENRELYEITLSVEYHLFRIFKENGIRLCNIRYQSCPYRYRANTVSFDEFMNKLNIDATVISYTPGTYVYETVYHRNIR